MSVMRTGTAITLVLLGGGATAMAVQTSKRCQDPSTGEPVACSSSYGSSGSSHFYYSGYGNSTGKSISGTSASSVSRGGFGSSGFSFHMGS